ncbi:MAG: inositol monophosphatase family protein [Pseudonocardiaceae bacterium]
MINKSDVRRLLAIAENAATVASELVRSHTPHTLTWKGDRDVTSDVDLAVEKLVRDFLCKHTPNVGFSGEVEGGYPGDGIYWVLDPSTEPSITSTARHSTLSFSASFATK